MDKAPIAKSYGWLWAVSIGLVVVVLLVCLVAAPVALCPQCQGKGSLPSAMKPGDEAVVRSGVSPKQGPVAYYRCGVCTGTGKTTFLKKWTWQGFPDFPADTPR